VAPRYRRRLGSRTGSRIADLALNPHTIEDYAQASCEALLERLAASKIATPELWVEPGRYIVTRVNNITALPRIARLQR
jgi:hypothetical protein